MKYTWLIWVGLLVACGDEKPVSIDWGLDYFPLRVGQEWTYAIHKTTYSYLNAPVESDYQQRISVIGSTTATTITTYTLQIETRTEAAGPWQIVETWTARVQGSQLIVNESNINRVKLVFPVGPATTWDGNQYNNEPPFLTGYVTTPQQRLYRIEDYRVPRQLQSGLNFDNTLTVVLSNLYDAIIGQDLQKEVYAHNVGLIFKEVLQLEFCTTGGCSGQQRGEAYTQTLIDYVP
ncbi:MAG: hypothetical protein KF775_18750 [Cyclobacteriaceae bacterium]|nr:hypothetical protein [Cyclobacteriaceae bacterium]